MTREGDRPHVDALEVLARLVAIDRAQEAGGAHIRDAFPKDPSTAVPMALESEAAKLCERMGISGGRARSLSIAVLALRALEESRGAFDIQLTLEDS